MYDENGDAYLDCINNVAHGEILVRSCGQVNIVKSFSYPAFFFKTELFDTDFISEDFLITL